MRWASLVVQVVKNLPAETQVRSLDWEDPLEKWIDTHSSIPAWRIPWTKELEGLQPMGSQRVGHSWVTNAQILSKYFPTKYLCWVKASPLSSDQSTWSHHLYQVIKANITRGGTNENQAPPEMMPGKWAQHDSNLIIKKQKTNPDWETF